ncbi:MAG: amino acid permease [Cytophagaceae bacterium]|nr:amino acid permease [Gemmatimonadaceae bacterium]
MTPPAPPPLVKTLGVRDLVLFNVVAVLSLRWMATSAAAGPSALSLWVLAGLLFFVPLGLAVSYLSVHQPAQGGMYVWTKRAFGEGHGFMAGWCYWVNNVLYPANLLIATSAMFTYAIGRGGTGLEENWTYVLSATLVMLWIAVAINIVGLQAGKWLQNIGAVATYLPGLVLIALGVRAMLTQPPANPLTLASITPDLTKFPELNLWASVAFAFTGIELSATMNDEIRDPRRSMPRAVAISAALIAFIYLAGTLSVLWVVPSGDVNVVSGFLQSIQAASSAAGPTLAWLVPSCALLYVIGNIGGVGAWLIGPARVAFMIGIDRYLPPAFGSIHPRWKTPWIAILVQAGLSTVFLLLSVIGKGTTVERAYLILLDTMLLIYFIPFVYLFLVYMKVAAAPGQPRRALRVLTGVSGIALTTFAMVVACIPPSGTPSVLLFELKVVGGAASFVLVGLGFYLRNRRGMGRR